MLAAAERTERIRLEATESVEREKRDARAAREELSATVQALRAYYEGQRQGQAAARAAAAAAAQAALASGAGSPAGAPAGGAGSLPFHGHAPGSPTVLKPLRGKGHVASAAS